MRRERGDRTTMQAIRETSFSLNGGSYTADVYCRPIFDFFALVCFGFGLLISVSKNALELRVPKRIPKPVSV